MKFSVAEIFPLYIRVPENQSIRMLGIETASRACKISIVLKGQRSEKVTTHYCLWAFRLKT